MVDNADARDGSVASDVRSVGEAVMFAVPEPVLGGEGQEHKVAFAKIERAAGLGQHAATTFGDQMEHADVPQAAQAGQLLPLGGADHPEGRAELAIQIDRARQAHRAQQLAQQVSIRRFGK
jgi:hypothetical protein